MAMDPARQVPWIMVQTQQQVERNSAIPVQGTRKGGEGG